MKTSQIAILFASLCCVALIGQPVSGQINLPNLNPFSKGHLGQPSTWERMQTGTKRFAKKTANVLTFGKYDSDPKPAARRVAVTGTQRTYRPGSRNIAAAASKQKKSGMFSWLPTGLPKWMSLRQPEPEPGPSSVSEWLKQPRP